MAHDITHVTEPLPADPEQPRAGQRSKLAAILIPVAVGVVMLGGLIYAAGADERDAKSACMRGVDDALVAPATAAYTITLAVEDAGTWSVYGKVDSENRFGATIRSDFRCAVTNGHASVDYVG